MSRCPQCHQTFSADIKTCPNDGAVLVQSPATPTRRGLARMADSASSGAAPAMAIPGPATDEDWIDLPEAIDEVELQTGTTVGEYQITGFVGSGGMGTVYAGVHPVIGKKVAIKVLRESFSRNGGMAQRFVQEARAVNQIGHRNIVDIFAFGQLPSGAHYFVMELLEGKSLRDRLSEAPLTYGEALTVLGEICDALAAAHSESIIHRDLKPDNIFIAQSKKGAPVVKLLDFGIAKLLRSDEAANGNQTRTGAMIGTPLYMSPEQCRGLRVDARADVYSLGVIMFELFTGHLPFPGPSYADTVAGHLSQPAPHPSSLARLPAELDRLIGGCLEKDPAARPASVEAVAEALARIAQSVDRATVPARIAGARGTQEQRAATTTAPMTPSARARAPSRRSRLPLVAVAAVGVLALAAGATRLIGGPRTTAPPPELALQVSSAPPGAAVILDGKKQVALTPAVYRVPHAAQISLRVEKQGFLPWDTRVAIADGEREHSAAATLVAEPPLRSKLRLRVNSAAAKWKLDGNPAGEGAALELEVAAGTHRLSAEAKGMTPAEQVVDAPAGGEHEVELKLSPVRRVRASGLDDEPERTFR